MRSRPALTRTAACLLFSCLCGSAALAGDFTCKDLVLTRILPGAPEAGEHVFANTARLHLTIDEAEPARSALRWTGDPKMEGISSTWPENTRIVVENGIIAASFAASRDGASSVGSMTLDAGGALRMTESTLTPQGVIYDVIDGACHTGSD
jgi:hypothetical protein